MRVCIFFFFSLNDLFFDTNMFAERRKGDNDTQTVSKDRSRFSMFLNDEKKKQKVKENREGERCHNKIAAAVDEVAVDVEVMDVAHKAGLRSSATMMFGHVETIEERIEHMERVRAQQDATGGCRQALTASQCTRLQREPEVIIMSGNCRNQTQVGGPYRGKCIGTQVPTHAHSHHTF